MNTSTTLADKKATRKDGTTLAALASRKAIQNIQNRTQKLTIQNGAPIFGFRIAQKDFSAALFGGVIALRVDENGDGRRWRRRNLMR